MAQIGLLSVNMKNKNHEMWVYEKGTKHEEVDRGDPQSPNKYCIIILSGDLKSAATAKIYSIDEKKEDIEPLAWIRVKKDSKGNLDYL